MAGLIPFNRNSSMFTHAGDLYNMLDDFFNDNWSTRRSLMSDTFKLDVKEDNTEYMIEVDLPGVKKEDVSLSLEDGRLTLSVSRDEETSDDSKNYIHRERRFSSMQRSIYLADADEAGVSAKLDNGVLSITVPKQVKSPASCQIEIQ